MWRFVNVVFKKTPNDIQTTSSNRVRHYPQVLSSKSYMTSQRLCSIPHNCSPRMRTSEAAVACSRRNRCPARRRINYSHIDFATRNTSSVISRAKNKT